jgi:hypothetical protein
VARKTAKTTENSERKTLNDLPDLSKERIMTKIATGFAVLVLSVSGMALASGATTAPATAPVAPVKASAAATTTQAPAAGVTQQAPKVQAPVQAAAPATSTETKSVAPVVKPVTPEAGKADVKADVKTDVKKTDDKVIQGAAPAPAPKTTTN